MEPDTKDKKDDELDISDLKGTELGGPGQTGTGAGAAGGLVAK